MSAATAMEARLIRYSDRSGECWIWTGHIRRNGYGHVSITGGGSALAHRASYETYVGPIPEGMQLDHLCRNRACINPDHLEPVTPRENLLRAPATLAARNLAKTHCPQGHSLSAPNARIRRGRRECKRCAADYQRRRSLERKAASA